MAGANRLTVDLIDRMKPVVRQIVRDAARALPHFHYGDVRLEVTEAKAAAAENGGSKYSGHDDGLSVGARVLAGDRMVAPGYVGLVLGAADVEALPRIVREALERAHRRALVNAEMKADAREKFGALGDALADTRLHPIDVREDTVAARFEVDPRAMDLGAMVAYTTDVSRQVAAADARIAHNYVSTLTQMSRELFVSSEGASIDQSFALTQGLCAVVAAAGGVSQVAAADARIAHNYVSTLTQMSRELFVSSEGASIDQSFALTQGLCAVVAAAGGVSQELYDVVGHQRGWEVLTHGVHEPAMTLPVFVEFALDMAREGAALCVAPPLPTSEGDVTVVTDPHYNTLVSHEIIGHPVELDRALKMETAYAGRSWLLRGLGDHQIGQRVASPLVTAYSDPSLPGYGHYAYDHEGTPARRVVHIEDGVFRGFMNSRQTAAVFGGAPNGHWKATDASLVPLIRMSNTVFAAGTRDPGDIIREVDHGYYLVGHRIPSIAESRENFRISARKVYEIRGGQLGRLFRDGGIAADSRDYLMNVDAVGSDFRLYPIPNCGKGQPMQTKKLGNGGPTMRTRARVTGS